MVITKHEASTFDEYQVANLPPIEHRGYYYFPFQENSQIATQSTGIFPSSEIPGDYLCLVDRDSKNATVILAFDFGRKAVGFPSYEPTCEVLNTVFSYTPQISVIDPHIEQSTINIFDAYQHEEFDTDIAYDFTNLLDRLIRANGKPTVRIINNLINKHVLENDIISETLKALGRIEDENTKDERYELLMRFIINEAAIIRDGAVSGLSFLDDKRALPQLRMLFETETVPILKNNIKVAIKGLETY